MSFVEGLALVAVAAVLFAGGVNRKSGGYQPRDDGKGPVNPPRGGSAITKRVDNQ